MSDLETNNTETEIFLNWLKTEATPVLAIGLDADDAITNLMWNPCSYADEDAVVQISNLENLGRVSIVASRESLPDATLTNIRGGHPHLSYQREFYAGEPMLLTIEKH